MELLWWCWFNSSSWWRWGYGSLVKCGTTYDGATGGTIANGTGGGGQGGGSWNTAASPSGLYANGGKGSITGRIWWWFWWWWYEWF